MKKTLLLSLFVTNLLFAQVPTGYYDHATGSGYVLKTQLMQIIDDVNDGLAIEFIHTQPGTSNSQAYSLLRNAYSNIGSGDVDDYYDTGGSNTILDMYSENPSGTDPYTWDRVPPIDYPTQYCATQNGEGQCLSREHILPQGFFNQLYPMRADIHFVIPADARVNGLRANSPFGVVTAPTNTFANGSKLGPNTYGSFSGTVYEPVDEFKGDIARMLLYFAVRYQAETVNMGGSWDTPNADPNNVMNGLAGQFYDDWFIGLLCAWHSNDPVSQKEVDRNNNSFAHQQNRNPFIDNPNYVSDIWGEAAAPGACGLLDTPEFNSANFRVFPNPVHSNTLYYTANASLMVSIIDILGNIIYRKQVAADNNALDLSQLNSGIYFVQFTAHTGAKITKKIIKK
jgi:endonuclease I